MGQIVSSAAKPKRCNLNKLSQLGTPAAGEYILVSSDNSMNAAGQGNFDCYIVGDGQKAATALELKSVDNDTFDISAYHATGDVLAKYADLSAALGANGANIPQPFRKGGMSVMFVQSSDNKYVRFNYMGTSTAVADFTNVANWLNVEQETIKLSQSVSAVLFPINYLNKTNVNNNVIKSNNDYEVRYIKANAGAKIRCYLQPSDSTFTTKSWSFYYCASIPSVGVSVTPISVTDVYTTNGKYVDITLDTDGYIIEKNWKDSVIEDISFINMLYLSDLYRLLNLWNSIKTKLTNVPLEVGNISITSSGWAYSKKDTRVRLKEGDTLHLYEGDKISLSDYTDARMYIGWRKNGQYKYAGWLTQDFIVEEEADYVVLLSNIQETTATVSGLGSLLNIISISYIPELATRMSAIDSIPNISKTLDRAFPFCELLGNYNIGDGTFVKSNNHRCYTITVHKNDKIRILMRTTNTFGTLKGWNIAYVSSLPKTGDTISNINTNKYAILGGQISDDITIANDGYILITYYYGSEVQYLISQLINIDGSITENEFVKNNRLDTIYPVAGSLVRYHHLFVDKLGNNTNQIIPSQSLSDIRLAAKLGFKLVELNVLQTLDGKFVCRHGISGSTVGGLINKTTGNAENVDISNISYSDLINNYYYQSLIPQCRVPFATLEETLAEIRKNNLQPFVTYNSSIMPIVEKYFGKRYVAYQMSIGTSRPQGAEGIAFMCYDYTTSTVSGIKAAIDKYGAPYMHGIGTSILRNFSDDDIVELLNYAHSKGCSIGWAGCYMTEEENQHYLDLGLDFTASGWDVPEFEQGNIIDIQGNSLNGFTGFTLSGGATIDSDGVIVLAEGESISASAASKLVGKCLLDVTFKGNIKVTMGQHIVNSSFTESDIVEKVFTSIMENEALAFTITAESETHIYSVDFKGSQVM